MASRKRDRGAAPVEGWQGDKTHNAFQQRLHSPLMGSDADEALPEPRPERHRLTEDRQQHDEAEKNSEKNRVARKSGRGGASG